MTTPAFKAAASTVIPFGKYKGQKIDKIAFTNQGLLYLDWLRGEMTRKRNTYPPNPALLEALCQYLNDPTIQRELTDVAHQAKQDYYDDNYGHGTD